MFTFACSSEILASISMQAVQTMPFCTDWFLFLPVGYILTTIEWQGYSVIVCLPCTLRNYMIVPHTLLLDTLPLLWPGSFLLDPWLSPLQWINQSPFKKNKNSESVSEEGTASELKNWERFLWDQTFTWCLASDRKAIAVLKKCSNTVQTSICSECQTGHDAKHIFLPAH